MATRFEPHGQFRIWVEGRIICSDVLGPWNLELVQQCLASLDAHARVLAASGPHVGLAIVRGSILCPPDAFTALHQGIRYSAAHYRCIGNVVVGGPEVEGWTLLRPMYERMYSAISPYYMADDVDSGRQWALALLAQAG